METSIALIAIIGTIVSLVASLLTNLIATKTFIRNSKITIGGVEIQFSESGDESTKRIIHRVQELQESPQVFISYSFKDEEFAQQLATDLRLQGVKVWLADEQLKVGDIITGSILEGISSSQWVIVVLSKDSMQSDFIGRELLFALKEERKRGRPFVLPAVISNTKLPIQLQDRQFADFRDNYDLGLKKILTRVKPSITKPDIRNQFLANKDIMTDIKLDGSSIFTMAAAFEYIVQVGGFYYFDPQKEYTSNGIHPARENRLGQGREKAENAFVKRGDFVYQAERLIEKEIAQIGNRKAISLLEQQISEYEMALDRAPSYLREQYKDGIRIIQTFKDRLESE